MLRVAPAGHPHPRRPNPGSSVAPATAPLPVARFRIPPELVTGGRSVERDGEVVGVDELLGSGVGHVDRAVLVGLADAGGSPHLLGDLDHDLGVLGEERLGVLPALPELLALVRVPGTRLLHEAEVDAEVEHRALAADALAVHDVELGLLERWGDLVLDDLHPRAVADDLDTVLQRLDAADVEPDRAVELQRPTARGGLGRAE